MIVYTCRRTGFGHLLGNVCGCYAVGCAHAELIALAAGIFVIVGVLIIQLNFHVIVDVIVQAKGIGHCGTAVNNSVGIEVDAGPSLRG